MSTGILTLTRRAALLGSVATAARAQAAGEISFGAVLSATAQTLHARWAAFLEDVSKVTGMRITGFFGADEAAVIEAMRTGKVQIASLSNETAIQAVDRAQAEVFAEKTYPDGTSFYRSLLIASKEGPLQSLEDVLAAPAGTLTFRDGEPNSVSGSLIPAYYAFAKSGIDAASRFKRVVTGDAETNLLAVAEQIVDFGTADTRSYERFRDRQPERALSLRKIWQGPPDPRRPAGVAKGSARVAEAGPAPLRRRLRRRSRRRQWIARAQAASRAGRLGPVLRVQRPTARPFPSARAIPREADDAG